MRGLYTYAPEPLVIRYTELPQWVFWLILLLSVVLSSMGAVYWVASVTLRPLRRLQEAARLIGKGEMADPLPHAPVLEVQELTNTLEEMRQELGQALRRQAELEQERRDLVAGISHDLRTPLASVKGYLEGIRDGVATRPEQLEQYVAICLDKTGHLERMVSDLFDYAHLEYLQQPPALTALPIAEHLPRWVDGFRPAANRREIGLVIEPGAACQTAGDLHQLERIMVNLLENALRHPPPEGASHGGMAALRGVHSTVGDRYRGWRQPGGASSPV